MKMAGIFFITLVLLIRYRDRFTAMGFGRIILLSGYPTPQSKLTFSTYF